MCILLDGKLAKQIFVGQFGALALISDLALLGRSNKYDYSIEKLN